VLVAGERVETRRRVLAFECAHLAACVYSFTVLCCGPEGSYSTPLWASEEQLLLQVSSAGHGMTG